jgi:hypothetical protein
MMKIQNMILSMLLLLVSCCTADGNSEGGEKVSYTRSFVQVSPKNPNYFQLSNGDPYLAIGCNICWGKDMETMERYFKALSDNGGNFARIWLSNGLFEYQTKYGEVNQYGIGNVDKILNIAGKYGIKVKFCIEDCRVIAPSFDGRGNVKISYHVDNGGPFNNMTEYITTPLGKSVYLDRVQFYKDRYGDDARVFGWELWNEMNAVSIGNISVVPWNQEMLPKVQVVFSKNMVMQSLGSMDREWSFPFYQAIMAIPGNDVTQVHRYLDEGAPLDICHAPMDILTSDAVEVMRAYNHRKPVLLAETGAVKPNHTGPHQIYESDKDGMLLHDILFAPFFSGAAGPGHCWHWDQYIDKNNLWYHFRRFANVVEKLNPIAENFVPMRKDQQKLRIYILKSDSTMLVWCRDVNNTWQTELVNHVMPEVISAQTLDLSSVLSGKIIAKVQAYDPWIDRWSDLPSGTTLNIPDFRRSIVLKIKYK